VEQRNNSEAEIRIDGVLYVPVYVNEAGPFWLLCDTGYTGCSVTPEVARKAEVEIGDGDVARLQKLTIGCVSWEDIMFGVSDEAALTGLLGHQVDGFLGNGFIYCVREQFELVIDYPRRSLAFREIAVHPGPILADTEGCPQAASCVPVQLENYYTIVPVHINGHGPYRFVLDTGAATCIVSPQLAQRFSLPAGERDEAKGVVESRMVESREAYHSVVSSLSVGRATCENLEVLVMDCSRVSGYVGDPVDGYVGNAFLQHFAVTLNYRDKRILLR
jgi:hypothetical protein